MQHYSSQAFTDIAKPAGGATIAVKIAGTNNNATIYSDDGVTVKSNPFSTNNLGQFDFYVASGKYDITISGTQITTYTLPNQVLFDPFEQSAGDSPLSGVVPLNIADQGGFWPPFILTPQNAATGGTIPANNNVGVCQFVLPFSVQVGKITVKITTSVANAVADVGIYSIAGNRLLNTGGFSAAVQVVLTTSIVPIILQPGFYYYAWTLSNFNAQLLATAVPASGIGEIMNNQTTKKYGIAANAASAGVLPQTLGTISASLLVTPVAALFER